MMMMRRRWRSLFAAALGATILLAVFGTTPVRAQTVDELKALNQRVVELYQAGKYAEAIPLAERYAEGMKTRYGQDATEYATALNNLAQLLQDTNRLSEAEPLMRRALVIFDSSLGPEHPSTRTVRGNLAALEAEMPGETASAEKPGLLRRLFGGG